MADKNPRGRPRYEDRAEGATAMARTLSRVRGVERCELTGRRLTDRAIALLLYARSLEYGPGYAPLVKSGPAGMPDAEFRRYWREAEIVVRALLVQRAEKHVGACERGGTVYGLRYPLLCPICRSDKVTDRSWDIELYSCTTCASWFRSGGAPLAFSAWRGPPLPGRFRAGRGTPIGRRGEVTLDVARQVDADDQHPLCLVEIDTPRLELIRNEMRMQPPPDCTVAMRLASCLKGDDSAARHLRHLLQRAREVEFVHLGDRHTGRRALAPDVARALGA